MVYNAISFQDAVVYYRILCVLAKDFCWSGSSLQASESSMPSGALTWRHEGYWNRMKETKDAVTTLYTTLTSAKNGLTSAKDGLTSAKNGGGVIGLTN